MFSDIIIGKYSLSTSPESGKEQKFFRRSLGETAGDLTGALALAEERTVEEEGYAFYFPQANCTTFPDGPWALPIVAITSRAA